MRKAALSLLSVSGLCGVMASSAWGQYTFEMRLIPDGVAGAPTGLGAEYSIGDPGAVTATRIGFWLQARVAQTVNQNWGIDRFSRPAASQGGGEAFIRVNDSANAMSISRGTVNSGDNLFGRGAGYRNGPGGNTNNTNAGNTGPNYENGHLDDTGPEGAATMIYNIDCYLGATRTGATNPWGVNGGTGGVPWPSDGTFAPWANLYRVWIDIYDFTPRTVSIDARGLLNGTVQTQNIGGDLWPMQTNVPNGQVASSIYTLTTSGFNFTIVPAPGAAAALSLCGLAAIRRRR
ncbi:MAG TPA: hypothetical protein VFF65_05055 [Phycisphaerales bacterium]|nr:hypothetical protein [Phycisphaerales bacterium]